MTSLNELRRSGGPSSSSSKDRQQHRECCDGKQPDKQQNRYGTEELKHYMRKQKEIRRLRALQEFEDRERELESKKQRLKELHVKCKQIAQPKKLEKKISPTGFNSQSYSPNNNTTSSKSNNNNHVLQPRTRSIDKNCRPKAAKRTKYDEAPEQLEPGIALRPSRSNSKLEREAANFIFKEFENIVKRECKNLLKNRPPPHFQSLSASMSSLEDHHPHKPQAAPARRSASKVDKNVGTSFSMYEPSLQDYDEDLRSQVLDSDSQHSDLSSSVIKPVASSKGCHSLVQNQSQEQQSRRRHYARDGYRILPSSKVSSRVPESVKHAAASRIQAAYKSYRVRSVLSEAKLRVKGSHHHYLQSGGSSSRPLTVESSSLYPSVESMMMRKRTTFFKPRESSSGVPAPVKPEDIPGYIPPPPSSYTSHSLQPRAPDLSPRTLPCFRLKKTVDEPFPNKQAMEQYFIDNNNAASQHSLGNTTSPLKLITSISKFQLPNSLLLQPPPMSPGVSSKDAITSNLIRAALKEQVGARLRSSAEEATTGRAAPSGRSAREDFAAAVAEASGRTMEKGRTEKIGSSSSPDKHKRSPQKERLESRKFVPNGKPSTPYSDLPIPSFSTVLQEKLRLLREEQQLRTDATKKSKSPTRRTLTTVSKATEQIKKKIVEAKQILEDYKMELLRSSSASNMSHGDDPTYESDFDTEPQSQQQAQSLCGHDSEILSSLGFDVDNSNRNPQRRPSRTEDQPRPPKAATAASKAISDLVDFHAKELYQRERGTGKEERSSRKSSSSVSSSIPSKSKQLSSLDSYRPPSSSVRSSAQSHAVPPAAPPAASDRSLTNGHSSAVSRRPTVEFKTNTAQKSKPIQSAEISSMEAVAGEGEESDGTEYEEIVPTLSRASSNLPTEDIVYETDFDTDLQSSISKAAPGRATRAPPSIPKDASDKDVFSFMGELDEDEEDEATSVSSASTATESPVKDLRIASIASSVMEQGSQVKPEFFAEEAEEENNKSLDISENFPKSEGVSESLPKSVDLSENMLKSLDFSDHPPISSESEFSELVQKTIEDFEKKVREEEEEVESLGISENVPESVEISENVPTTTSVQVTEDNNNVPASVVSEAIPSSANVPAASVQQIPEEVPKSTQELSEDIPTSRIEERIDTNISVTIASNDPGYDMDFETDMESQSLASKVQEEANVKEQLPSNSIALELADSEQKTSTILEEGMSKLSVKEEEESVPPSFLSEAEEDTTTGPKGGTATPKEEEDDISGKIVEEYSSVSEASNLAPEESDTTTIGSAAAGTSEILVRPEILKRETPADLHIISETSNLERVERASPESPKKIENEPFSEVPSELSQISEALPPSSPEEAEVSHNEPAVEGKKEDCVQSEILSETEIKSEPEKSGTLPETLETGSETLETGPEIKSATPEPPAQLIGESETTKGTPTETADDASQTESHLEPPQKLEPHKEVSTQSDSFLPEEEEASSKDVPQPEKEIIKSDAASQSEISEELPLSADVSLASLSQQSEPPKKKETLELKEEKEEGLVEGDQLDEITKAVDPEIIEKIESLIASEISKQIDHEDNNSSESSQATQVEDSKYSSYVSNFHVEDVAYESDFDTDVQSEKSERSRSTNTTPVSRHSSLLEAAVKKEVEIMVQNGGLRTIVGEDLKANPPGEAAGDALRPSTPEMDPRIRTILNDKKTLDSLVGRIISRMLKEVTRARGEALKDSPQKVVVEVAESEGSSVQGEVDGDAEWFEDELISAGPDDESLKREAAEIVAEQLRIENEIRALEALQAQVPATLMNLSDVPDKPPPPYSPPSSDSLSFSMRPFQVQTSVEQLQQLVSSKVDQVWPVYQETGGLPPLSAEPLPLLDDDDCSKAILALSQNEPSGDSPLNNNTAQQQQTKPSSSSSSPPGVSNNSDKEISPSIISTRAFNTLLHTLIHDTIKEALLIQDLNFPSSSSSSSSGTNSGGAGKDFVDRIRPGSLALAAQKLRIPRTKASLSSLVFSRVKNLLPFTVLENHPPVPRKRLTKWTSRPRDLVDEVLAEELVDEDRDWIESWPEEILVLDRWAEKFSRKALEQVVVAFKSVFPS